jgi:hypothetical protein
MSNATINSILARCIVDTAFLDQLASDPPGALNGYALEPQTYADFLKLDIARLRGFAGLVTKVQNNGLWEHFLYTRKLLNYYRIDLEVFTAYRDIHLQNRRAGLSRNQQIERFLSFLWKRIEDDRDYEYLGLREILAHEKITWETRLAFSTNKQRRPKWRKVDIAPLKYDSIMKLIPVIPGLFRLAEFTYDPLEMISNLTRLKFDSNQLSAQPRWLAYWADDSTGNLRILELDQPIASFLSQVNGRHSIRNLIRRVLKGEQAAMRRSEFRPFLQVAFQEGLLAAAADSR